MDDNGPIGRVVNANPCLIADLEHHNFNVIQEPLEYYKGLANISAGLLAFGFLPATSPIFANIIREIGVGQVQEGAIGFTMDLLLQVLIRYYWPNGGQDISWQEAANLDSLDYYQASASGIEGVLSVQFQNAWAGRAITASSSCLVDGFTDQGELVDGFSAKEWATGAFSALLIGELLNNFPWVKTKLQTIPKPGFTKGIVRFFGEFDPNIHQAANIPSGLAYKVYQFVHGDVVQPDDVMAIFDIPASQAGLIAQQLEQNNSAKDILLKSDWWLELRTLASSADLRGSLIADLANDVNFANALKNAPAAERAGWVRAWEFLFDHPNLRVQVNKLKGLIDDIPIASKVTKNVYEVPGYSTNPLDHFPYILDGNRFCANVKC